MTTPRFVIQLLVENAIKYSFSRIVKPEPVLIEVNAYPFGEGLAHIDIKDNAGDFYEKGTEESKGFGMKMVNELIKAQFGSDEYGWTVDCEPDKYTIVTVTIPIVEEDSE